MFIGDSEYAWSTEVVGTIPLKLDLKSESMRVDLPHPVSPVDSEKRKERNMKSLKVS